MAIFSLNHSTVGRTTRPGPPRCQCRYITVRPARRCSGSGCTDQRQDETVIRESWTDRTRTGRTPASSTGDGGLPANLTHDQNAGW